MSGAFADIVFTPSVLKEQEKRGAPVDITNDAFDDFGQLVLSFNLTP